MTIHHTAIISPKAKIGTNVEIGPNTIIYDNVEIDDNTIIGAFCEIGVANYLSKGLPLIIGKNSNIRSHSIFYEGSTFEDGLTTGHRVTVRELVRAGKNLQIGTLSDLQGHCEIGDYVRFHSNVHIGQHSKIGNFVWIFPYVVLTNDPHPPSNTMLGVTVEDYALIATMSVILPGAVIAEGCLIGAHSSVKGKTEKHSIYVGSPAKSVGPTSRIKLEDGSDAYPWTKHFKRGYPEDVIKNW
ncbi:N-acetyltransferase [Acinetobacter terrestris]|uniref:N-acetyltransferase n=1 Tax=Acinetobacter terrestris TaxID=2529843 RepID=UPI00103BA2C3|nr:N-acetyltransferase [Acinetobacter terrestris]TCB54414.1 N-acetyltransferase [Acinetobacter terrestris]